MIEFDFKDGLLEFYEPFFNDREATLAKLKECYSMENPLPRRIINYTQRLITLGDDAGKGRGGHGIEVSHFVICIEALTHLLYPDEELGSGDRMGRIKNFFSEYVSKSDKSLLRKGIVRSIIDERGYDEKLDITVIARVFSEVRNKFVHEGIYYEFSFSADHEDNALYGRTAMLNNVTLKEFNKDKAQDRTYEISLTYDEFRSIMIRACLNFLDKQIKIINYPF